MSHRKLSWMVCALSIALLPMGAEAASEKEPWKTPAPWVEINGERVPDGGMPRYIQPETPEQRKQRLAIDEDPGINPDPNQIIRRLGRDYSIRRYDRRYVFYTKKPGWVRPHPNVNFTEELYQENEKWVWVWVPKPAPRRSSEERKKAVQEMKARGDYPQALVDYVTKLRPEFEPLDPPASPKKLRFEESSAGLPNGGSFRNSPAVADMNGDGFADIVTPAERGTDANTPSIFLGDGKGNWKRWNVKWPAKYAYGSVVAADFNRDKKMDVAFGIHLNGVAILLGDGTGQFREVKRISDFPTRRIIATDVDADGWTDVVALFEGPIVRDRTMVAKDSTWLRAWLNRKKGEEWAGTNIAGPKESISGDWLAAADLNGDRYPDFVGSSLYHGNNLTHYLSTKDGKYEPLRDESGLILPRRATYHAVTSGRFTSRKVDDTVVAAVWDWPRKLNTEAAPMPPFVEMITLDRLSFEGGRAKRTPIMRYGGNAPVYGLGSGDVDGDGNRDIVFTRQEPREAVFLLGDGKGGFTRASVEGIQLPPQRNYDVTLADVNGDKRLDLILMYETNSRSAFAQRNGRVQVFLNRGAE